MRLYGHAPDVTALESQAPGDQVAARPRSLSTVSPAFCTRYALASAGLPAAVVR
jgi:hypothetical protein